MAKLMKKKENPHKDAAIQLFAFNHGITNQEVADKIGVSHRMIRHWREDPEFHLAVYNCYMGEFDSKLPSILDAMVREAQEGNVQAGRLILEHSGKLVKNIINVSISPYEMFLNKTEGFFNTSKKFLFINFIFLFFLKIKGFTKTTSLFFQASSGF